MRVLLVNKFWYRRGGAEQVVFLTKELLEQAGHTVAVFGMRDSKNEIQTDYFSEPINFDRPHTLDLFRIWYNFEAKKKFKKLIIDFKPEVIHFHNIYHQLSFSLIDAGREAGVPMVMTIHDYHWLSPNYRLFHHGQIERNWQKQSVFTTIIRNRLETFSKSVVGAIDFKIRSQKKYRQSISTFIFPTQFCFNLHNQVGWSIKQSAVISYPLPNSFGSVKFIEGKYVLFVGRLSPEKGLMTLLQVAAQTPDIPYIIMGEGQERKKIEIQIKKLRISNVTLVGYQTGADRENFLQNARIIVVPSEWFENPSLVAPEGALFQKIVLGSRIGGIPEELPGEYLIKPGNVSDWVLAITDWFNKSEVQRKSIGNSLSIISRQKHDSKKYLEKIIEVYQNSKYEKI